MRKHACTLLIGSLLLLGLVACSGAPSTTAAPTPTLSSDTATSTSSSQQGAFPTVTCDEAVQRILHNDIGLVQIYRQKEPIHGVPNSVVSISIYPRSAHTNNPAEPYDPWQQVSVYPLDYPDHDCYPRLVTAVKQVNKHLSKDQQVELQWPYTVS